MIDFSNSVVVYHFPFIHKDKCEICNSNQNIDTCAEKIIDAKRKNWIHVKSVTLCCICFKDVLENKCKRDIYLIS